MSDNEQALDFSTVIASTVHDMKNSLAMLMQAHSQWLARLPELAQQTPEQGVIDFEFAHLNGMLVQLLGLYKLCLLYTSPSPRDGLLSRMPSSA